MRFGKAGVGRPNHGPAITSANCVAAGSDGPLCAGRACPWPLACL